MILDRGAPEVPEAQFRPELGFLRIPVPTGTGEKCTAGTQRC